MVTETVVISEPETLVILAEGPLGSPNYVNPHFFGNAIFTLLSTEQVVIDARTNPRAITLGVFRIEHTSNMNGTRPITLDIDANGFHTKGIAIEFLASNINTEGECHILEVNVDTANSTKGEISALSVNKIGVGLAEVTAIEAYSGVNILEQKTGDSIFITQAWKESNTVFTDVTTAFSNGTNETIFNNDNDYIYCGTNAKFNQIEVNLATMSSHTIDAIFEYSTGTGTWTTFGPADGTNGFTTNGNITWNQENLTGWVSSLVNGVSKYYIRIQRTRNNIITLPIESTIKTTSTVDYYWDKTAKIKVRTIESSGIPLYADRAAAQAGGLTVGQFYQTSAGVLMIV